VTVDIEDLRAQGPADDDADAPVPAEPTPPGGDAFIAPVPAEEDLPALFPGDTGTLEAPVRQVLARLLRQRHLSAAEQPRLWRTLLVHQATVESRLHDLFVDLVVDHDRGLAYKRQVRDAEVDVPVLLRDEPYTRLETVLLVHLRAVFQREHGVGEQQVRVDAEELEQTVLSFLPPGETNVAARQRETQAAVARLVRERVLAEETPGRYRVLPVIEVILSVDRLAELARWLREDAARGGVDGEPADPDADLTDDTTDDTTDEEGDL
jgi:hypothetical protein